MHPSNTRSFGAYSTAKDPSWAGGKDRGPDDLRQTASWRFHALQRQGIAQILSASGDTPQGARQALLTGASKQRAPISRSCARQQPKLTHHRLHGARPAPRPHVHCAARAHSEWHGLLANTKLSNR